ncbi:MAG: alpha/beta hydrolase, partial [Gemmatimonadaceae bacterium]
VRPKDWPQYQEWGRLAAAAGLVGVTFVHRLTTDDNVDVAGDDMETLLRHVREHAREYSLDPNRLCIALYSAGGPLAAPFLREPRPYVRCLVLYYPFLDLNHVGVHSPFRGPHSAERVAALASYSPARWLVPNADRLPPIFLARGGRDVIPGINSSIDRFMNMAFAAEIGIDFYLHRSGPHGLDRPAGPDARSEEIVRATVEFLRRHLTR